MYQDSELPKVIADGQYTLQQRIGQGGMAVVYLAQVDLSKFDYAMVVAGHEAATGTVEERLAYRAAKYEAWKQKSPAELKGVCDRFTLPYPRDSTAAVKVMIPQQREDAAVRFEAEWRQLLAINHPHLIKVFGGGREGDVPYYSMEVVRNIIPIKQARQLPEKVKLDMVFQAAGGLQALHQRGIIHRDIKPANLLCSREGDNVRVRVMDLGIAKLTGSTEGLTLSHHVMGTPYYMSPEQAGSSKNVDLRADIYSLGAALYSLICGSRPYEGKSMYEVVGSLVRGERPERPADVNPEIDPLIGQLIERMMELEIDARLQSMEEVRLAIQAIFTGDNERARELLKPPARSASVKRKSASSEIGKRPGSSSGRGKRANPRYQGHAKRETRMAPLLIGGGVVICALLALIIFLLVRRSQPTPVAPPSSSSMASVTSQSAIDPVARTKAELERMADEAVRLMDAGEIKAGDAILSKMFDLAIKENIGEGFTPLNDRIKRAKADFIDNLAKEALRTAKEGSLAEAKALLQRLSEVQPGDERINEIEQKIEERANGQGRRSPGPSSAASSSALASSSAPSSKPPGGDPKLKVGHFRPDTQIPPFVMSIEGQQQPLRMLGKDVTATVADGVMSVTPKRFNGFLSFVIQAPVDGYLALEVPILAGRGPMHIHLCSFRDGSPADLLTQDEHYLVDGPTAQVLAPHPLPMVRMVKGQNLAIAIVFKEMVPHKLGVISGRLVARPGVIVDPAQVAALRRQKQFLQAYHLAGSSDQILRDPEKKAEWVRLSQLARFEYSVVHGQLIAGERPRPLHAMTPAQALAYAAKAHPKPDAMAVLREARFRWEVRDPEARERALAARQLGANVNQLLAEIDAGR